MTAAPSSSITRCTTDAALAALVILAGVWAALPAIRGGWIWDDSIAVVQNPLLRSAEGLRRIWLAPPGPDYFPLTSSVQWAQWHAWGLQTFGYHCTNVALHLTGALLLWRTIARLGVACGWVAALLFAVHPLTVESVAWISELKNVLALPLLLLAFGAFLDFDESGQKSQLVQSLVWFLLSLLAKSSGVMFPIALLGHALWRRGRVGRRDLWAALPFLVLSIGFGLPTFWFQAHRAAGAAPLILPAWPHRCAAAVRALGFYFSQSILPRHLLPMYPGTVSLARWAVALGSAALLGVLALRQPTWRRSLGFGVGWFVLNLIPVLGFLPMVYLRIAPFADHLAYLPLTGLCALAAAGFSWLVRSGGILRFSVVSLFWAAPAALLGFQSRGYSAAFKNERALWTYTLDRNPAAWQADLNLGCLLLDELRPEAAMAHFRHALVIRPNDPEAVNDLGNALVATGRSAEAVLTLRQAVRLDPTMPEAHYNLGNALAAAGRPAGAIDSYETALRLHPDFPEAENSLATILARTGRLPEAVAHYQAALRLNPAYDQARGNLAQVQAALAKPR